MGLRTTLRFLRDRARETASACSHLDAIRDVTPSSDRCVPCVETGDAWVHLRMCETCGLVACCDSSKNRHAHRHADEAGHPIARSMEAGEDWRWCYVDELLVDHPPA